MHQALMNKLITLIGTISVFFSTQLPLYSEITPNSFDWPHHLGPNYNGISNEKNLQAKSIKKIWESQINIGFSGITIVKDYVYTMGNDKKQDIVYCLDRHTGKPIWQHSYKCRLDPNMYEGGPNATPTVHDGKVYTLSKEGHIYCLDWETGEVYWSRHAVDDFKAQPPSWGFSGSPTIIGDSVLYNVGSSGLSLDKLSGKTIWSSGGDLAGYASVIPFEIKGKTNALLFNGNKLVSVNIADGKELWSYRWKTSYKVNAAAPLVFRDHIFVSSGYNHGCSVINVHKNKPKKIWFNRNLRNQFSTSIVWKKHIFGVDGNVNRRNKVKCIDMATGKEKWSNGNLGFGSLIFADNKLFILSDSGDLVIAEANTEKYIELYRNKILSGKCWTAPAISNGRLYARNAEGTLVCLYLKGS